MDRLVDSIKRRVDEEGAGPAPAPATDSGSPHTTTQANIAFLPSGFLKKKKKKVKTSEASEKEFEKGEFDNKISRAVYDMFSLQVVRGINDDLTEWKYLMGGEGIPARTEVLIDFETRDKDADATISKIMDEYSNDIGNIEMVLDAMKKHKPLRAFEPFVKYDYLVGSRIRSYVKGTEIVLEGFVDMLFQASEKITTDDKDLIDKLPEYKTIKVVGKTIYPVGNRFVRGFFKTLKDLIKS